MGTPQCPDPPAFRPTPPGRPAPPRPSGAPRGARGRWPAGGGGRVRHPGRAGRRGPGDPAAAPSPLWPDRTPAPAPTGEQHNDVTSTRVPGVPAVPSGDVRDIDP
ncbi:hypothetical protein ACFQ2B_32050 [Streptomyces stramineus]